MLTTAVRFGPKSHGRLVTDEELEHAEYRLGYDYEVIFGRLFVSPAPNREHDVVEKHIYEQIVRYRDEHPEVVGCVTDRARIFVPGVELTTAPEPDLAVYAEDLDDWRDGEPFVVGEVLRGTDIDKDLFRNPGLYLRVPTIQEYWVFDIREEARRPKLWVYRRVRDDWDIQEFPPDTVYETPLLPGLKLRVSPPPRPAPKRRRTKR
ncbi:MAG: Uma2 family endonuclease [Planctomycetaceae bacterium]|nr:Uma2 family endonuclease [Planctomycetaceae bacterium]